MGKQLIFVVEADKKCKSDWIYIRETLNRFYVENNVEVKYSPIFLGGNSKYAIKQKEIDNLIKQYKACSKDNTSIVIFVMDTDDYDSNQTHAEFLEKIERHCKKNRYEHVWCCRDIERVYVGKKVSDGQKKATAEQFKKNNDIRGVDEKALQNTSYRENTSNILIVLDKYLTRK